MSKQDHSHLVNPNCSNEDFQKAIDCLSKQISPKDNQVKDLFRVKQRILISRLTTIWNLTFDIFGSDNDSQEFLNRKHYSLNYQTPLEVTMSGEEGFHKVQTLLNGIKYGTYL